MKKILFSAASALAFAGVAVAADSTEFGVLYVPSTDKETIVAVPWLASGTGNDTTTDAVKVADLVLTTGLVAAGEITGYTGDQLMYYPGSGKTYQCWVLQADQTTGVKSWVPGNTVTTGGISTAAGESDAALKRGQAIILKRNREGITKGFHIMGKPSNAGGSVELAAGCYTLVAPPSVSDTDPNTLTWNGVQGRYDCILVPQSNGSVLNLGYKGTKWVKSTTGEDAGACIPAGTGVWFKNGGTTSKSVSWAAAK